MILIHKYPCRTHPFHRRRNPWDSRVLFVRMDLLIQAICLFATAVFFLSSSITRGGLTTCHEHERFRRMHTLQPAPQRCAMITPKTPKIVFCLDQILPCSRVCSLPRPTCVRSELQRHRKGFKKLNLPADQRKALLRGLTTQVIWLWLCLTLVCDTWRGERLFIMKID